MKTIYNYLIIFFLILVTSCVEYVSLNTIDEREMVAECVLFNSDSQELRLYYTKKNDDSTETDYEIVTEGDAVLYMKSGKDSMEVGRFVYSKGDKWMLKYRPESECTYSLKIEADGHFLYASTSMPDSISNGYGFTTLSLPSGYQGTYEVGTWCGIKSDSDCLIWIYNIDKKTGKIIPDIFTSHDYVDNFNMTDKIAKTYNGLGAQAGLTLTFYFHSYFLRIDHKLGYLNNYHYYIKPEHIGDFLRWIEMLKTSEYIDENNNLWGPLFMFTILEDADLITLNVSAEYDMYLKSSYQAVLDDENTDFVSIFRQQNNYSNISGGKGIFGAAFKQVNLNLSL